MKVLVIEDDPKISSFIAQGLQAEAHTVDVSADGQEGLARASTGSYDLVLLDLMLPRLDGLEVLRRLRVVDPALPVIAVSARGDVEDRVRGLDCGADDYLPKPFSFVELLARIRALFRLSDQRLEPTVRVGELHLDRLRRTATRGKRTLELSAREHQLLELFLRHADQPLTRAIILDRVWGYQFDPGTNVVDVYVNYLRRKLKDLGLEPIRTLRGIGYVLDSSGCAVAGGS